MVLLHTLPQGDFAQVPALDTICLTELLQVSVPQPGPFSDMLILLQGPLEKITGRVGSMEVDRLDFWFPARILEAHNL